jgi:hypothetical protein
LSESSPQKKSSYEQYSRSILVETIKHWSNPHQELRIIAVTDGNSHKENNIEPEDIRAACCPPCHGAVCVGRADYDAGNPLGLVPDMIDLADFCICNLSAVSDPVMLQRYASQTKHTVLLDMNRVCAVPRASDEPGALRPVNSSIAN